MKINYLTNRGKAYTEEEDRFIVCLMQKIGYGRWEEIKLEIRKAWQFRFDWFIKSRTPQELNRRGDLLVKLIRAEKDISEGKVPEPKKRKAPAAAKKPAAKKKKEEEEEKEEEVVVEEEEEEEEDDDEEEESEEEESEEEEEESEEEESEEDDDEE